MTGVCGFISSHLIDELVKQKQPGDIIIGIDDLSEGKMENIKKHIKNKSILFTKQNILSYYGLPDFPKHFDVVYHLAAKHCVPKSFEDQESYYMTNIIGTWRLLNKYKDSRFINVSSSSAKTCLSPYAISKEATERMACLHKNAISIRFFNVFGEKQADCGVLLPSFCKAILHGKKPVIFGNGDQERDLTYVKDLVREVIRYGSGDLKEKKGLVDVGYSDPHSVNEIFKLVSDELNYVGGVKHLPKRIGDVDFSCSGQTMKDPKYGFEKGIERTVKWYKNNIGWFGSE